MIFIDTNIFMFAAGGAHANKAPCTRLMVQIAEGAIEATTSTEVLQEILHRYRAIRRWEDGRTVYDLARQILESVVPITVATTDRARELMDAYKQLSARDALHAACCESIRAELCSYDTDFDAISEVSRITPDQVG